MTFASISGYYPGGVSYLAPSHIFKSADNATEYARIDSSAIKPGLDNVVSLGTGSLRMSTLYAGTSTISTSDEREKVWRGALTETEKAAAREILAEVGVF